MTRTALATHCLGFLFLLCAVWLLTAAAIGRVLPRGSVVSHAPALTSHSDDSLSALLASTTHCRSFSLCFAQLQPSFLSLTHGPTDDRLRKVVKHSATCRYSLHSNVLSFSDDYCQSSFSQQHGNLLLSRICSTTSLFRSPSLLQVHLAVNRAVSAFTTVLTGTVNTFLVSHSSFPSSHISTIRLVGEYCSELTHHNIRTHELFIVDILSI